MTFHYHPPPPSPPCSLSGYPSHAPFFFFPTTFQPRATFFLSFHIPLASRFFTHSFFASYAFSSSHPSHPLPHHLYITCARTSKAKIRCRSFIFLRLFAGIFFTLPYVNVLDPTMQGFIVCAGLDKVCLSYTRRWRRTTTSCTFDVDYTNPSTTTTNGTRQQWVRRQ